MACCFKAEFILMFRKLVRVSFGLEKKFGQSLVFKEVYFGMFLLEEFFLKNHFFGVLN